MARRKQGGAGNDLRIQGGGGQGFRVRVEVSGDG